MPFDLRPDPLPVAIMGAGPIGLAAAAELLAHGQTPLVLEAGPTVATTIRAWGHVRMFSPWRFNVAPAARARLLGAGWVPPDDAAFPTGAELVARYLEPLAATLAPDIRTGAHVIGVARRDHGRLRDGAGRDTAPFVLHLENGEMIEAAAVLDCSGTWGTPNPAGAHGLPAPGEASNTDRIATGIPDVLGADRAAYAGATTLVVGAGHSAMNAVLDLVALARQAPGTRIVWAFRRPLGAVSFGGGAADGLAERGALGARARALVAAGAVEALAPFRIDRIAPGLSVTGRLDGRATTIAADRMIVATGFRPDLGMLREIRLGLDPVVETTPALAPLIDPNLHSCGSVRPHGEAELRHPEHRFWIAGMKSYGRAPTFLLATGHEQVRSIAAALAGDWAAAREVRLELPETGVCATDRVGEAAGCCAPTGVGAGASPARSMPPDREAAPAADSVAGCCAAAAIGRPAGATTSRPSTVPVMDGRAAAAAIGADATACCTPTTPQGACCPPKPELAATAPCCGA